MGNGIHLEICSKMKYTFLKYFRGSQSHDAVDDSSDLKNVICALAQRQNKTPWNFINVDGGCLLMLTYTRIFRIFSSGAVEDF